MENDNYPKRRIFCTASDKHFKIFTFEQNKNDGSIYVNIPNFMSVKWFAIPPNEHQIRSISDLPGDGKVSFHASGLVGIKTYNNNQKHDLIIHGNILLLKNDHRAGTRHLFTAFLAEPKELPESPAFNRKSDYSIYDHSGTLEPFVIMFFAIPMVPDLTIEFRPIFNTDYLEEIPPKGGFGNIPLEFHNLFWFVYRTKHMNKWPKYSQIFYSDGYLVPIFIGADEGKGIIEVVFPTYELSASKITITLPVGLSDQE